MNYSQTVEFLFNSLPEFQRVGAPAYKAGLDTSFALDAHLDHPHRKFRSIHIAGTNGKGSTSQMIYTALRAEGYRVGLYTSPHLTDFRERIIVDEHMISQEGVVEFVTDNHQIISDLRPSFFEMTVALAFWWFERSGVDYAVIEVGMGGRLDSTNIITPILSVITNISKDHTQFLGDTIEKIAGEKAGIIKPHVPVIIGESNNLYNAVFTNKAVAENAPITFADREAGQPYTPSMQGDYQKRNAQTAAIALRTIGVPESSIKYGIETAVLRGRWQILSTNPLTICDTGHNVAGITYVTDQLKGQTFDRQYFVIGVVSDKDLASILPLLPRDAHYIFTQASVLRAMPVADLASAATAAGLKGDICPTVDQAIEHAQRLAKPSDMIFIGGSTFTVADALSYKLL